MRLAPIAPDALAADLRHVHDEIVALMARSQPHVVARDASGGLVGPFPTMLHFPRFGVPVLTFQRTLGTEARLSKTVREVAILTVAAAFGARYELYAHEITAVAVGLSSAQTATLAAGGRPAGLGDEEAIAHEVARLLATGRIVPTSTYDRAVSLLGLDGFGELVFLAGGYGLIAMVLNAFDVPVPREES